MKKNFLPPSYWRYKKGPDLNLAPQSTIYSYGPDNINFLFVSYWLKSNRSGCELF